MNYRIDIEMKKLEERSIIPGNATGLFKVDYCVLVQIPSSGGYTYKAVNYVNFKSIKIGTSKKNLTPEKITLYAGKMKILDINNIDIPAEPQELLQHIFTEVFPSQELTVKPQQVELASQMLNSLLNGNISLTEAEVGSGKTIAYLTAAILFRLHTKDIKPIVITTSSIQLQREIIEKHLPMLSNILVKCGVLNNPVTAVIRKGKEHYICDKRLNEHLAHLRKQRENRENKLPDVAMDMCILCSCRNQ